MALWQFKFSLVPAEGIRRLHGGDMTVLQAYQAAPERAETIGHPEISNYWDNPGTLRQLALASSGLLPEMKSWSQDARMFGEDDSNKIEVWDDNVECCVDMRYFSEEFLKQVINMAKKFNCKLSIHGAGVVIEPDMAAILDQIVVSNAYKFCVSPQDYLKKI